MTRDQLETLAMEYLSAKPSERTGETLTKFAVKIYNWAKEEDAVIALTDAIDRCFRHQEFQKGACGHDIRDAIRAMKANP